MTRRLSLLASCLMLALAGSILVRYPPTTYGFYPACPFHQWTGLLCPGCGGTRALAALLRGNFAEAFRLNALVVALAPLAASWACLAGRRFWRGEAAQPVIPGSVCVSLGILTTVFGVMRNLG